MKEVKRGLSSWKDGEAKIKKILVDLKWVCEDLAPCASELNNVISDLKVKLRSLKVINDEFGANVVRLETTLKIAQAKVGQNEKIEEEIGLLEAVK